jgi:hypothetical protein
MMTPGMLDSMKSEQHMHAAKAKSNNAAKPGILTSHEQSSAVFSSR